MTKGFIIFQGELLPSTSRSFGCGLLGIVESISLFISVKYVPDLNKFLGMHGTFYFYSGNVVIVAIISYFVMPETSGKTLEEIENMFRSKGSENNNKA